MARWAYSTRLWPVFVVALLNAALFALLTPLWQAPDEPGHVEYACLMAELRRAPRGHERSAALQARILDSLARHDFWRAVQATPPPSLPVRFADDPFLARSASQIGDEAPWYYGVPAALCTAPLPLAWQVRLMRLWGALLFAVAAALVAWAWGQPPAGSVGWLHPRVFALLPMPAFIAGSVNNDALALAAGALVFAVWQRRPRGWQLLLAAALLLALAAKKTTWFLLPWLVWLSAAAGWRALGRRGWSCTRRMALSLLAVVAVGLLLQLPTAMPAGWRGFAQLGAGGRVRTALPDGNAGWAVHVVAASSGQTARLIQNLDQADNPVAAWRGQTLTLQAWVRRADGAPGAGRLLLRDAAHTTTAAFTATDSWQPVVLQHSVALTTTYLTVVALPEVAASPAETGGFLLAVATLRTAAHPAREWLHNGNFQRPARLAELLAAPWRTRWQQFAPRLALAWPDVQAVRTRLLYLALLFPGFWGNFGWLQRPLPLALYLLLALWSAAALFGLLRRWPVAVEQARPRGWVLAVMLAVLQTVAPMIGRDWQPQGRYLFPALLPITALLVVGLDEWAHFAAHPRRGWLLLAAVAVLNVAGLLTVTR